MVTNIKLNDDKYIATFEICDNNEDYSICNLGQKLTNDVIQVNKTFIDIDIYKSQMKEQDQRIAELEKDLEFTTKTANELIEIKHKLEQELAELKEKDNYHLRYELAGADETITNLKKQIKENGKEINTKNNKLAELKRELTICKDTLRRKTQSNRDLQHRVHNVNTQLAIQELEKVKTLIQNAINFEKPNFVEVYDAINNQIKELKGE